jgi:16S rRNA (cytidine1402-2'-O)-methyltransferase
MNAPTKALSPALYLVATPIGLARDITLRALDVLAAADVLAAEDTRSLRHLMQIHGLALGGRPLFACHDHSGPAVIARLAAAVAEGQSVAYAAEAGTPLIADPGFTLARAVRAAGGAVVAAPGASAVLTALVASGLPAERFLFLGFLPAAAAARRTALGQWAALPVTLVCYESPKRIREMLGDCCDILGEGRQAALCRELTKKFEEVRQGSLGDLAALVAAADPKGECVVVIGPPAAAVRDEAAVRLALGQALQTMRLRDAATAVAGALGLPRRDVYRIALGMEDEG